MASVLNTIDSAHDDMIHDAALDYYGTKLATCSSDKTIKIFNVQNGEHQLITELRGHEGPVWQVAWAHPSFGNILASCSFDRNVVVWREDGANGWQKSFVYSEHESSVNSIAWAPHEFGLIFACASSDGAVSIVTNKGDNVWHHVKIPNAHTIGCNAVSWAPYLCGTSIDATGVERSEPQQHIVTGGCDNLVKIWRLGEQEGWQEEQKLAGHTDWVRDVAWAPSLIVPRNIIASCSQDRLVIIWTNDDTLGGTWETKTLNTFDDVVWHLSWSVTGNILAVSTADNKVTLWKETIKGDWVNISDKSSTS